MVFDDIHLSHPTLALKRIFIAMFSVYTVGIAVRTSEIKIHCCRFGMCLSTMFKTLCIKTEFISLLWLVLRVSSVHQLTQSLNLLVVQTEELVARARSLRWSHQLIAILWVRMRQRWWWAIMIICFLEECRRKYYCAWGAPDYVGRAAADLVFVLWIHCVKRYAAFVIEWTRRIVGEK